MVHFRNYPEWFQMYLPSQFRIRFKEYSGPNIYHLAALQFEIL